MLISVTMAFDTPIPLWLIAVAALLLAGLAFWLARGARTALPRRYLGLLLALRLTVIILLALLAANPYWAFDKPDPAGVRIAVLADVSGSMSTTDAGDQARIDVLQELLNEEQEDSLKSQLAADYSVEVYPFVESLGNRNTALSLQPGTTAIGQTLDELLQNSTQGQRPLGAVVLLSDGISLTGESPLEAGKRFRAAGVPMSTIGIGSERPPANLALHFKNPPRKAPAGDPLTLQVTASNDSGQPTETIVDFYAGDTLLDSQPIALQPGETAAVNFEALPDIAGFQTYRARLHETPENDLNSADDSAYAAVEITPPDKLEVLYLSNRPGYTFRFLQQLLKSEDAFTLRALIRLGEDKFMQQGFEGMDIELPTDAFPSDPSAYLQNRVLIVETSVLPELEDSVQETLRAFLEDRAGGVLFMGPPELVPQPMQGLLPVRHVELVEMSRKEPLTLTVDPVFRDAAGGVLFMPPGPYLPSETPTATAVELSRGARVAATTNHGELPVLALQAYGAGRAAFLGTESSWRWQMDSARGGEQYRLFWSYLLSWLGAGGKPRLDIPTRDTVRAVGEPLPLELRVLGRDFLPAPEAQVRARLQGPNGQALPSVTLTPSPYEPGLFTGLTVAQTPGEYQIDYSVTLPDGERLDRQAFFVASRQGRENEDVVFRDAPLRDLARMTGGNYASFRNASDILPLKLASGLPMVEERVYWTHTALFLISLLALAALEWFLRRRVGLR